MSFFKRNQRNKPSIEIDGNSVRRYLANGKTEEVHWKKLGEVSIMTNDKGPFEEDVFWVLTEDDGQNGCIIPLSVPESQKVLERVQKLPGFDNEKFVEAMSSSQNMEFLLWKKDYLPH